MAKTVTILQAIPPNMTVQVTTTDTTAAGDEVVEASGPLDMGTIRLKNSQLAALKTLVDALVTKARAAAV